jgi:hypothetical protein
VPQGSRLGPSLFNLVFDQVLQLRLPSAVSLQAYADDLALCCYVGDAVGEAALAEGLGQVETCLEELGLALHPSKTLCLLVSLRGQPSLAQPLRLASGEPIRVVASARFLGVSLARRLNLEDYWLAEARKLKALGACLHRLVHGHRAAFALLVKSHVEGRLRHAIGVAPPTTEKAWTALCSAFAYIARLQLNEFRRVDFHLVVTNAEVVKRAGFAAPRELSLESGLCLLYAAIFKGRAYGADLQLSCGGRTRSAKAGQAQLVLPDVPQASLRRLAPYCLASAWNGLRLSLPPPRCVRVKPSPEPLHPLASLRSFKIALPSLLSPANDN